MKTFEHQKWLINSNLLTFSKSLERSKLVKQSTLRHFLAANCVTWKRLYTFVNLIFNKKLTQNHLKSFSTNTFPCQKYRPYLYSKRVSRGLRGGPWGLEGFWFGGFGLQGFTKDSNGLTKAPKNSWNQEQILTFQGTNRSDLGKSKIFLKYTLHGGYVSFQDIYWLLENWSLGESSSLLTLKERLVKFVSMRFSWLCLLSPEFIHARIMFGFASLGRWTPKKNCPWYSKGGMDDEIVGSWKCWCWPFLSIPYD